MKNKLMLSALAIAIAAPGVASATEVTVGGIVQVQQFISHDTTASKKQINGGDVRILVSASETVGDYTSYANYRIDSDALSGTNLTSDSVGVGLKGSFGDLKFGATDDVQFGEYANDIYAANPHLASTNAWGYTGSFGGATIGAIWSPDTNEEIVGLGGEFAAGPVTLGASFGTVGDGSSTTNVESDNSIIGAKIDLGAVTVAAHTWDIDSNAAASAGDSDGTAVKLSGSVAAWSWGLTATDEDAAGGTVGDQKVTRLDLGTSFAGLGIDFRYDKTKTPGAKATDWLRLQLSKSF